MLLKCVVDYLNNSDQSCTHEGDIDGSSNSNDIDAEESTINDSDSSPLTISDTNTEVSSDEPNVENQCSAEGICKSNSNQEDMKYTVYLRQGLMFK